MKTTTSIHSRLGALGAAVALTLSACGPSATPAPTPVPTPAPATSAPAAAAATLSPTAPSEPAAPTEPSATTAPTAAPTDAAAAISIGDPLALLSDAMRKQLKSGPYRSKTVIVSADGTTEGTGKFIPPDRLHITSELGGGKMEMIYIGDKGWSKDGDAWTELKLPGGGPLSQIDGSMIDDLILTITDVKLVGPELLDGRPTIVVSYVSDLSKSKLMTMDVKSNVKVWIGATDGLVYKQVIEGDAGGVASTTTQTVEYDPGIVIEAPAP